METFLGIVLLAVGAFGLGLWSMFAYTELMVGWGAKTVHDQRFLLGRDGKTDNPPGGDEE